MKRKTTFWNFPRLEVFHANFFNSDTNKLNTVKKTFVFFKSSLKNN